MSWANASYLPAVMRYVTDGRLPVTGKDALRRAARNYNLNDLSLEALRRYSSSVAAGCEDGKTLNASLILGDGKHDDWAEAMDAAFVWSFSKDIILWRGGELPGRDSPSECFISTSLVERTARKFGSTGGNRISAILLPAGSPVAIPKLVWMAGDNPRTVGVVEREMEIVLPRGTVFENGRHFQALPDRDGKKAPRISLYYASTPTFNPMPIDGISFRSRSPQ